MPYAIVRNGDILYFGKDKVDAENWLKRNPHGGKVEWLQDYEESAPGSKTSYIVVGGAALALGAGLLMLMRNAAAGESDSSPAPAQSHPGQCIVCPEPDMTRGDFIETIRDCPTQLEDYVQQLSDCPTYPDSTERCLEGTYYSTVNSAECDKLQKNSWC